MGSLPVLNPQEVVQILNALGFEEVRQRGSRKQFRIKTAGARPFPSTKARHLSDLAHGLKVDEMLARRG